MTTAALRPRRTIALIGSLAVAASLATFAGPLTTSAHAAYAFTRLDNFDARLVQDINHARVARGLRPLTIVAGTTDVAHSWACRMASRRLLEHNPQLGLQLDSHGSTLWTTYAENVGMQPSSRGAHHLFRLYMHSPEHRRNILDPSQRFIGVWSKRGNGRRWNTIDFVGSRSTAYSNAYGATRVTC